MKAQRHIEAFVEVRVPVRVAYDQWMHFESFPAFMEHVEAVRRLDEHAVWWRARVGTRSIEWAARIVEQVRDKRIAWRSFFGLENSGAVTFQRLSADRCRVMLHWQYTADSLSQLAASLLGFVERSIRNDLMRFRDYLEEHYEPSHAGRSRGLQRRAR